MPGRPKRSGGWGGPTCGTSRRTTTSSTRGTPRPGGGAGAGAAPGGVAPAEVTGERVALDGEGGAGVALDGEGGAGVALDREGGVGHPREVADFGVADESSAVDLAG